MIISWFEFLFLNIKSTRLRCSNIFGKIWLLFIITRLFLWLHLLFIRICCYFCLYSFINICKAYSLYNNISFSVVKCLLWLIWKRLYLLVYQVLCLFSFILESVEGVPIKKMPPESFTIMKFVIFFGLNVCSTEIIVLYIF